MMRGRAHADMQPSPIAAAPVSGLSVRSVVSTREGGHGGRRLARLPLLVLVPLLVGILGGPTGSVGADELSDARARQNALAAQLRDQKAQVAQINALQADLGGQIASTRQQLNGINANLATVKASITSMMVKIDVVRQDYYALVSQVQLLDTQLSRVKLAEMRASWRLEVSKDLLAERLRQAYDTNRTSLLETFLSGGSFTDVLSEVSYSIDMGEQDKALAAQIGRDQQTLVAIHQTVVDTRTATDSLRAEAAAQRVKLDQQLTDLKAAQAQLKRLEAETARALAIQNAAYAKLAANKTNLAKAIATAAADNAALTKRISDLVAAAYARGNIPSQYNGTLIWPMAGQMTQDFGCTGFTWEPPVGSCSHFHQGIDLVADYGTPVHASGDGQVLYCGWNYADGADPAWIVIVAHSGSLETWYAHLQPGCPAPPGSAVTSGQVIGNEGDTGHSTGAHLHWAVRFNGEFVNPRLFL
ncbi:MAG: hypothetical protein NVS9B8_10640 [Candidatus Limnocylindrales bacterium]